MISFDSPTIAPSSTRQKSVSQSQPVSVFPSNMDWNPDSSSGGTIFERSRCCARGVSPNNKCLTSVFFSCFLPDFCPISICGRLQHRFDHVVGRQCNPERGGRVLIFAQSCDEIRGLMNECVLVTHLHFFSPSPLFHIRMVTDRSCVCCASRVNDSHRDGRNIRGDAGRAGPRR